MEGWMNLFLAGVFWSSKWRQFWGVRILREGVSWILSPSPTKQKFSRILTYYINGSLLATCILAILLVIFLGWWKRNLFKGWKGDLQRSGDKKVKFESPGFYFWRQKSKSQAAFTTLDCIFLKWVSIRQTGRKRILGLNHLVFMGYKCYNP